MPVLKMIGYLSYIVLLLLPAYSKLRLFTPFRIIFLLQEKKIMVRHTHCNITSATSLNKHKSNNNNLTLCYYHSHISHMIPYFSGKVLFTFIHGRSTYAVITIL